MSPFFLSLHPSSSFQGSSLYKQALFLVRFLNDKGYVAFFAGGAVRDMVLARPVEDIDIATNASTEQLLALFPHAIQVGAQFGVIRVIRGSFQFEIATFRTEGGYEDGRHPTIVHGGSSYEEDAQRRDFTINGLFYDPLKEEVIDCVHGLEDIDGKVIRAIGVAKERFYEDKLRVLRAIRFSHLLNFKIHSSTLGAMRDYAQEVPKCVSGERIWDEIRKMYRKGILKEGVSSLFHLDLFASLFTKRLSEDELNRRLLLIQKANPILPLFFGMLLYDVPTLPASMKQKFKLSNQEISQMENWYRLLKHVEELDDERVFVSLLSNEYSDEKALLALAVLHSPNLEKWYEALLRRREELLPWIEQKKTGRYIVMGQDLIRRGIDPGKRMGELLDKAFTLSLKKRLLVKEDILHQLLAKEDLKNG